MQMTIQKSYRSLKAGILLFLYQNLVFEKYILYTKDSQKKLSTFAFKRSINP